MDDSPPTAGILPGAYYPPRDDPREVIDRVAECYTAACQRIKADIDESLREPESILRNQAAILQGRIAVDLDTAERAYLKSYLKVQSDARNALDLAYSSASAAGIPVPIDVGVKIGIESGAYLASNWIRDTGTDLVTIGYPEETLGPDPFQLAGPAIVAGPPVQTGDQACQANPGYPRVYPFGTIPLSQATTPERRQDYIDYAEWVYSLGDPWTPWMRLQTPDPLLGNRSDPNLRVNPNNRWFAYKGTWADCAPSPPPPPPPTPPPPAPPPTPPPPIPTTCPPPVDQPTACQMDTAWELFSRPYQELSSRQKEAVDCMCPTVGPEAGKPPPVSVPTTRPQAAKLKLPNWCSPHISLELDQFQAIATDPGKWLRELLQIPEQKPDEVVLPSWLGWLAAKGIPNIVPQIVIGLLETLVDGSVEISKALSGSLGEGTTANLFAETVYAVLSMTGRYLGFPPASWLRSLEKTINWQAPEEIPTVGDALEGYLSGAWPESRTEDYVRANNQCWAPMRELLMSRRTRINVTDATALYMQEKITEAEWRLKLRDLGVVRTEEQDEFRKLVDSYPQPPDLVRFMVRDATNQTTVDKYNLHDGFDKAWDGPILKYARAVGLNETEAKLYWAAHWNIPSNTQLYEMLHRLRPGTVPKDLEVTAATVKEALGINDILPYWQDRLMAISYSPLTRTDVQRAYFIDAMDEAEVTKSFQDNGYNKDDALVLTRFTKKLKQNQRLGQLGLPTAKTYISRYVDGSISARQLGDSLGQFGWDAATILGAIEGGKAARAHRLHVATIRSIKSGFVRGDLTRQEAAARLVGQDLDLTDAEYQLDLWATEHTAKRKLLTGSQLCKAWERGLLSPEEYQRRLAASGYSVADTARIMDACGAEVSTRLAKQQAAAEKRAKKEAADQQKELEKQRKKACEADKRKKAGKPPACDDPVL